MQCTEVANIFDYFNRWPGVEPTRGNYNETYLKILTDIVDLMEENSIFALLDCHQDVYPFLSNYSYFSLSEKFCGEGVPGWY